MTSREDDIQWCPLLSAGSDKWWLYSQTNMRYELIDRMTRDLLFLFVVHLYEISRQRMKEVNNWIRLRDVGWKMNH